MPSGSAIRLIQDDELAPEQVLAVARLHASCLTEGFLSRLGDRLLALLYSDIASQDGAFLIAAEDDGEIVGFVCGACRVGRMYKRFLLRHALTAGIRVLPMMLSFRNIRRVTETLAYPLTRRRHETVHLPEAELLSIAVAAKCRGTDVAATLYAALATCFTTCGETAFQITVGAGLGRAIRFYEKMGARQVSRIEVHRGEPSIAMVQDLLPQANPAGLASAELVQRQEQRA